MARVTRTENLSHVSTTLLGRTKLQATATAPYKPMVERPPAVRKPPRPRLAGL